MGGKKAVGLQPTKRTVKVKSRLAATLRERSETNRKKGRTKKRWLRLKEAWLKKQTKPQKVGDLRYMAVGIPKTGGNETPSDEICGKKEKKEDAK